MLMLTGDVWSASSWMTSLCESVRVEAVTSVILYARPPVVVLSSEWSSRTSWSTSKPWLSQLTPSSRTICPGVGLKVLLSKPLAMKCTATENGPPCAWNTGSSTTGATLTDLANSVVSERSTVRVLWSTSPDTAVIL